jgi:N-acetylglucosaminyldiphosphoundecaprenol N-acetyl-beta-D-mannosaminyltransferase
MEQAALFPLSSSTPNPYTIAGVQIHPIRLTELLAWCDQAIARGFRTTIMYGNIHAVVLAQRDQGFASALNRADLVFCDGQGLRLGAALLGRHLPERFTPPDWIDALAAQCATQGQRIFLLGSEPGVAERAARRLEKHAPGVICGTQHGYYDWHGAANDALIAQINQLRPAVLLVGMGMPQQERWLHLYRHRLRVPVVITVGALFDYLAERTPRGPRWLTDNGFEWLCRLAYEPQRLWKRYLLGNPYFFWLIARQFFKERMARSV